MNNISEKRIKKSLDVILKELFKGGISPIIEFESSDLRIYVFMQDGGYELKATKLPFIPTH